MTWTHIAARIAVFSVGWFITCTGWKVVFDWGDPIGKNNAHAALVLGTVLWVFVLGIVYW